jgi:hypothetical protein
MALPDRGFSLALKCGIEQMLAGWVEWAYRLVFVDSNRSFSVPSNQI